MSGKEAIAAVRVLVCVAKADGVVQPEEREALAAALEGAPLPIGTTLDRLLAESIDLDAQLGVLFTPEAKDYAFKSAYGMAYADGTCSPEEQAILDRVAKTLGVPGDQGRMLSGILSQARDSGPTATVQPVTDPARRSEAIREHTFRYSVLSAVLGALPVPGLAIATELAIVALQARLARDIGRYHGHELDGAAASSLLATLGIGTGAQMAVSNLAKAVPGWTSSSDPAVAFATTHALGRLLDGFFSSRRADAPPSSADATRLRAELDALKKEGTLWFHESRDAIAAKEVASKAALTALATQLLAFRIDQAEYERHTAALA